MASEQPIEQATINGYTSILAGVSNFGRKTQAIAGEWAQLSQENLAAGTKAVEKLRDARSLQDVTSIQTDLVRETLETAKSHYRNMTEIAASTPQEMIKSYREIFGAMTDVGTQAAQKAGDLTRQVGDEASKAIHETADVARQTADVASQAAETSTENFREIARLGDRG